MTNDTITLATLAKTLSDAVSTLNTDDATRLLRALTQTITDNLAAGQSTTINALGTFTPDAQDPGNPTFTPDTNLSQTINAPFEAFTPVTLPDGLDLNPVQPDQPTDDTDEPNEPNIPTAPIESTEPIEPNMSTEPTTDDEEEDDDPQVYILKPRHPHRPLIITAIITLLIGIVIGATLTYTLHDQITTLFKTDTPTAPITPNIPIEPDTLTSKPDMPIEANTPTEPIIDTITTTKYLTTIARRHYGQKDYWVYIYDANADHLRHPDRIKPGTTLIIPPISSLPLSADTAKNIANARARAAQIYNKYK